jgi:predicted DCC family thiol-disulfide oxidoreductase YuxK
MQATQIPPADAKLHDNLRPMMRRATLLYDQDCGFCMWTVARVLRRDQNRDLRAATIQSPEGQDLLAGVPKERRLESWHLVLSDGRLYSGGAVFAPLLRVLRRPGQAWLLERLPAPANWGYRAVAGRRSWFGSLLSGAARRRAEVMIAEHGAGEEIDALEPGPGPEPELAQPEAPPAPVPAASAGGPAPESPPQAAPQSALPEAPVETDAEPIGWQQRFEESPFGRGILSTLVLFSLLAIVAINLPGSDLRKQLLRPGQPYLNALGLDQNWSLFAPNPRRVVLDVSATVTYDDGRTAQWAFPHDGALLGTYRDYRWRKWQENLISPMNAGPLWRPAALWAATHETRTGHAVTRVALVERYASLLGPGVTPSTGPTAQRVFYVLHLSGSGGPA